MRACGRQERVYLVDVLGIYLHENRNMRPIDIVLRRGRDDEEE
jgi:hypothetical protein